MAGNPKHFDTVILGDSMVKGLRQHAISKARESKVQIKCFPGANLTDMKHYRIPPLSTSAPKQVVLHVGTNDIFKKDSSSIIQELCEHIKKTSPGSAITISPIITRKDDDNSEVLEVNSLLNQMCERRNYLFLTHNNIDKSAEINQVYI